MVFADDTNLFTSHHCVYELQALVNKELTNLDVWFRVNKLSLNINKTNYIIFPPKRKLKETENLTIKIDINGQEINQVYSTKFLGVIIDKCLNFKCHIDQLVKKLSKYVGLFFRLRHLLPRYTLLTLYRTFFEPHINYCNIIWGNTYGTHLKKLESLQKKIIRATYGLSQILQRNIFFSNMAS